MSRRGSSRGFDKDIQQDLERVRMEWRNGGEGCWYHFFKNKGDVQSCGNYRGIKLMSHTIKLWERVAEVRLRTEMSVCEQQ